MFPGLMIPVQNPPRVRRVERIRNLDGQTQEYANIERPLIDPSRERLALEQFHGDELPAVVFVDLVDRADVRVIERRRGARFSEKPFCLKTIVSAIDWQELERARRDSRTSSAL